MEVTRGLPRRPTNDSLFQWRGMRVYVYTASALVIFGPLLHYIASSPAPFLGLEWTSVLLFPASWLTYLVGAAFYINRYVNARSHFLCRRIPESLKPGMFDFIGSSHQIWHCFVGVASYLHLCGLVRWVVWQQKC